MRIRVVLCVGVLTAACGGGSVSSGSGAATRSPSGAPSSTSSTGSSASRSGLLPLGDSHVGTVPAVGAIDACPSPAGPGAPGTPPWIHGNQWDPAAKVSVQGSVSWAQASYSVSVQNGKRTIRSMDLPIHQGTGTFPIAASDPAHQYDANPNSISAQSVLITLDVNPTVAAKPSCLNMGQIGMLEDGVYLFDALDAVGRDAVAHEVLDRCDGHPAPGGVYHHHDIASCILATATGPSTLVGYALDGFGIYVERDAQGHLLADADLDECHGRTSPVDWDGKQTVMYHYDATAEFPYTMGCYKGSPPTFGAPPSGGPTP